MNKCSILQYNQELSFGNYLCIYIYGFKFSRQNNKESVFMYEMENSKIRDNPKESKHILFTDIDSKDIFCFTFTRNLQERKLFTECNNLSI